MNVQEKEKAKEALKILIPKEAEVVLEAALEEEEILIEVEAILR